MPSKNILWLTVLNAFDKSINVRRHGFPSTIADEISEVNVNIVPCIDVSSEAKLFAGQQMIELLSPVP